MNTFFFFEALGSVATVSAILDSSVATAERTALAAGDDDGLFLGPELKREENGVGGRRRFRLRPVVPEEEVVVCDLVSV